MDPDVNKKPVAWKMVNCHHCGKRRREFMNGYCRACLDMVCDRQLSQLRGRRRCITRDCQNYTDQGLFVGELCVSCRKFVVAGEGRYSQAYRNSLKVFLSSLSAHLQKILDPASLTESLADRELRNLVHGVSISDAALRELVRG